jgi:hypothetical protein
MRNGGDFLMEFDEMGRCGTRVVPGENKFFVNVQRRAITCDQWVTQRENRE